MRELLIFLCEHAGEEGAIREADIGVKVFGRQPGYDTAQDPIVRVQVSQLRKKLQQYFQEEGGREPMMIEVPRGAYTPIFCMRPVESEPAEESRKRVTSWAGGVRRNWLTLSLALIAATSLTVTATLLQSRDPLRPVADTGTAVDRLWQQVFAGTRPACIVVSDGSLVNFESMMKYELSLNEYRNKAFTFAAEEHLSDPAQRDLAQIILRPMLSPLCDSRLAAEFTLINNAHRIPTDIVFARDFGVSYLYSHNVILLGSRRANPWIEYFEDQLNFRTEFDESQPECLLRNTSPRPGESATYPVLWGMRGYCRVAYLANPTRNGSVLLISGTEMADTEAGGAFLTNNAWIERLRSTLRLAPRDPFPHFEVLLKVEYMARNEAPRFSIVTHRVLK